MHVKLIGRDLRRKLFGRYRGSWSRSMSPNCWRDLTGMVAMEIIVTVTVITEEVDGGAVGTGMGGMTAMVEGGGMAVLGGAEVW